MGAHSTGRGPRTEADAPTVAANRPGTEHEHMGWATHACSRWLSHELGCRSGYNIRINLPIKTSATAVPDDSRPAFVIRRLTAAGLLFASSLVRHDHHTLTRIAPSAALRDAVDHTYVGASNIVSKLCW